MGKGKVSSTLIACIAVGLVAIIAIVGVAVYGSNNYSGSGNKDAASNGNKNSSMVDTADTSSQPTGSGDGSQITGSTDNQSSSKAESSSKTQTSSKNQTSSESSSVTGSVPTPDDDPFEDNTPSGERVCYLTFDDGPCANTDKILKILKDNDVKATFFVVGTMATGKIKDIYNAGHAIGLHTNTHELSKSSSKYVYKSADGFFNDLKGISDVVYEKIGIRSNLTRFPGGSATAYSRLGKSVFETVKETLKEQGYTYFDWNIDSGDTHSKSPSKDYVMNEIRKGLKSGGKYKDEVCILMHDIKNVTVEALPDIIRELKEAGYTFKTLDSKCNNFAFK